MVPFLQQLGITVEQVTKVDELNQKVTAATDAVVISLAVTSTVSASVERVLSDVMRLNPNAVLIFSSDLPLRKKRKNLLYMLSRYFIEPCITVVGKESSVEQHNRCLYICSEDLSNQTERTKLGELICHW